MAKPEKWLKTSFVLSLFSKHIEEARKAYVEFAIEGLGKEVPAFIRNSIRKGILGSEEFVTRIEKQFLGDKLCRPDREKPQLKKLRKKPNLPLILSVSEKVLGARNRYFFPIVIYISHKNTALKLREIGEFFSLSISSVSNACLRARAVIAGNVTLATAVEEIEREVAEEEGKKI
jgi:hypothetical protein